MENYESRKELGEKLFNGDFEDDFVVKNVQNWLYDDYLIRSLIHGLYAQENIDLLNFITIKLNRRIISENPMAIDNDMDKLTEENLIEKMHGFGFSVSPHDPEDWDYQKYLDFLNNHIVYNCTESIKVAIKYSIELEEKYEINDFMISMLSKSSNRDLRLYCASMSRDYSEFFDDADQRVRKVTDIRSTFENDWDNKYSAEEKNFIEFLTMAIDEGIIICSDGLVGGYPDGQMCAEFEGALFDKGSTGFMNFDEDIFENITDKRILADTLYKLGLSGDIRFNKGIDNYINFIHNARKNKVKTIYGL